MCLAFIHQDLLAHGTGVHDHVMKEGRKPLLRMVFQINDFLPEQTYEFPFVTDMFDVLGTEVHLALQSVRPYSWVRWVGIMQTFDWRK